MPTPAEAARLAAGFSTPDKLAKRMGYSVRTVKKYERRGGAPDDFARRWARAVGASAQLVFHSPAYFTRLAQLTGTRGPGAVETPFNPLSAMESEGSPELAQHTPRLRQSPLKKRALRARSGSIARGLSTHKNGGLTVTLEQIKIEQIKHDAQPSVPALTLTPTQAAHLRTLAAHGIYPGDVVDIDHVPVVAAAALRALFWTGWAVPCYRVLPSAATAYGASNQGRGWPNADNDDDNDYDGFTKGSCDV